MKRITGLTAKFRFTVSLLLIFVFFSSYTVFAAPDSLIPVGKTVGITVSMDGVSVVNTAEFETSDGKMCSPAAESGILPGDKLIELNGRKITSVHDLEDATKNLKAEEMTIVYERGGDRHEAGITPRADISDGRLRIGVWVKDSASGIGTITYLDPESKSFGALGHGICTSSGSLIGITGGSISEAEISSVKKGEKGAPGELSGTFSDKNKVLGEVSSNTDTGVFGHISADAEDLGAAAVPVAKRDEVHEGDAKIMSNTEGSSISEYSVKITKINDDESSHKGMIIKVTDSALLEKTGGIVQGMSGSPIIQDGKLVGAITHVFINDPTRGYAIFIENMLAEAEDTN
ncbi:MAG: SpoIVB peptidase [Monoglobaceae bacterium]